MKLQKEILNYKQSVHRESAETKHNHPIIHLCKIENTILAGDNSPIHHRH